MDLVRNIFKHLERAVPPTVPHGHSKERARGRDANGTRQRRDTDENEAHGQQTLMISPLGLFRIVIQQQDSYGEANK